MMAMRPYVRNSMNMFDYFDKLERDMLRDAEKGGAVSIRTDIREEPDAYVLEAELPGFMREDIHVDIEGDMLTVHAEHEEKKEEEKKGYLRRERHYGSYSRSFDITGIDRDAIKGSYADGVLELRLPKVKETEPEKKRIELT